MPNVLNILLNSIANAQLVNEFYLRNDDKLPREREKLLKDSHILTSCGKEIWDLMSKQISNNTDRDGKIILYNIEMGDDSPLKPLQALFDTNEYGWKPRYVVNYFRGCYSPIPRLPVYIPDRSPLLTAYEKIQNGSRNTFNTVLSWALEKDDNDATALLVDCNIDPSEDLAIDYHKSPGEESKECFGYNCKITMSDGFIDEYLFKGNYERIIKEIIELSSLDPDNQKERYQKEAELIGRELELFRLKSIDKLQVRHREQFGIFASSLLSPNLPNIPPEESATNDSIMQILQGIAIMLRHWESRFICLTTREKPHDSFSFNGQLFILGIPTECNSDRQESQYLEKNLTEADIIQRILSRELYTRSHPTPKEVLEKVVGEANSIIIEKCVDNRKFNYNVLGGVLEFANCIRPAAIHEGHELRINLIVGSKQLLATSLESISDLSPVNIEWRYGSKFDDEALFEARAHILGNCQLLQQKDIALFIDIVDIGKKVKNHYFKCSHLVKLKMHRWKHTFPGDIIGFTQDNKDLFLIRINGRKRIELWNNGHKILVWSDDFSKWHNEETWSYKSIKDTIEHYLFTRNDLEINGEVDGHIQLLCNAIEQISQSQGEGASFVVYGLELLDNDDIHPDISRHLGKMTESFPGKGEGVLNITPQELKDVAIQDGGIVVDLTNARFYGRCQWLPICPVKNLPFNFMKSKIDLNDLKNIMTHILNIDEIIKLDKQARFDDNDRSKIRSGRYEKIKEVLEDKLEMKISPQLYIADYPEEFDLITFWKHDIVFIDNRYYLNKLRWKEWYNVYKWGTRHMNALGMSHAIREKGLVINVSADSYVTVFFCGKALRNGEKI